MNTLIESLNAWGGRFAQFAWPMLVQSTWVMGVLLGLNWVLARRVRAVFRYALLMLVLVKLVLPPSLAFPTGLGYWLWPEPPRQTSNPRVTSVTLAAGQSRGALEANAFPSGVAAVPTNEARPRLALGWPAVLLLGWLAGLAALTACWVRRTCQVARLTTKANSISPPKTEAQAAPPALLELLQSSCVQLQVRGPVQLRLSEHPASPAVCGLARPVILVPKLLVERLSAAQWRAVLLHELGHIKRGDLWVSHVQTLLQIFYWYNPFLWLANAVIRRVREQAVDELVMVAMRETEDVYPATLLEVAKLAFLRHGSRLGLVGITESKRGLTERLQQMLNKPIPRSARLGWVGAMTILAVAAIVLPMAKAERPVAAIKQVAVLQPADDGTPPRVPTPLSEKPAPKVESNQVAAMSDNAVELVKEGRLLYEAGKYTEAELKLKAAVQIAPTNRGAVYYLELVRGRLGAHEYRAAADSGSKRAKLLETLRHLRFDEVSLETQKLGDAVKILSDLVKGQDPEHKGIHFMLTGAGETMDLINAQVTIRPPLKNVTLEETLDALLKSASPPIKYSVEDYAIVFSLKGPETPPLQTRTFKVDPKTFIQGISGTDRKTAMGPEGTNAFATMMGQYFTAQGLAFDSLPALFFNDRLGILMVRGTAQDLAIIEQALQELTLSPPQLEIETKIIEVTETAENKVEVGALLSSLTNFPAASRDVSLATKLGPVLLELLRTFEHQCPVDMLAMPKVTTVSGRQTQVKVNDIKSIVTGLKTNVNPPSLTP
ncbi:MAG: M48 family metalloprotease, partial [Verrucomicrobia bacterium]|nr:M48 family metalloprotease [Verrucomicrobiota bacterium]